MKFGRYVIVDDGGNYVTVHELNVCRIIRHNESLSCLSSTNSVVLRMKQVNFKARFRDLQNRLVVKEWAKSRKKSHISYKLYGLLFAIFPAMQLEFPSWNLRNRTGTTEFCKKTTEQK